MRLRHEPLMQEGGNIHMADFKEITRLLTSGVPDSIQQLIDETHPADVLEAVQEEAGGDYKY